MLFFFFFSSRRRHTRLTCDWSSDVCSSDLGDLAATPANGAAGDPALHAALKAWRSEIARQRGVPAYVVLHDSTIDGIAASRPATLADLRGIAGIGDKKLEHYGEELLALVTSSRST